MTCMTYVTQKELALIVAIVEDGEFACGDEFHGTYAFVVCGDKSSAAVFGSLVKKGLASTDAVEGANTRTLSEQWVQLTDSGREVYRAHKRVAPAPTEQAPSHGPQSQETKMTTNELLTKYNLLASRAGKKPLKAWKDSKAKLQARIDALVPTEQVPSKPAKKPVANGESTMSVADVARELGINPKVARAKLRRKGIGATDGRYAKFERDSDQHKTLVATLKPAPKAKA